MYYSVLIETSEGSGKNKKILPVIESDHINLEKIKSDILIPYFRGNDFFMDGYLLNKSKISRIKIVSYEKPIQSLVDLRDQERRIRNRNSNVLNLISSNRYQIMHDKELGVVGKVK